MTARKIYIGSELVNIDEQIKNKDLLIKICELNHNSLNNIKIENETFEDISVIFFMRDSVLKNCTFKNCYWGYCSFVKTHISNCKFEGENNWLKLPGLIITPKPKEKPILEPKNEEIEKKYGCKVTKLPNPSFVKMRWVCDFCHREFYTIARRDRISSPMKVVPNCEKRVCSDCDKVYCLQDKFLGNRTYGYHGTVHKYKTDMDAENTAIIGLEMEFEGDFYGWKELQDAHKGYLHYGYDSSVIGQNELSWDCGSYSWWKYLSPLRDVCDALRKYGGKAGDSAGIHIHVSRPDIDIRTITRSINSFGGTELGKILFKAVSLRTNKEKMERYANLSCDETTHHSGISYNSHGTCEFRVFNSSLDHTLILKHIKFCKEVFNAVADNKPVWEGFSPETIKHIKACAEKQKERGFITGEEYGSLMKKINK